MRKYHPDKNDNVLSPEYVRLDMQFNFVKDELERLSQHKLNSLIEALVWGDPKSRHVMRDNRVLILSKSWRHQIYIFKPNGNDWEFVGRQYNRCVGASFEEATMFIENEERQ
eukprot:PhF_6_TR10783/c0_g1_i5/m.17327